MPGGTVVERERGKEGQGWGRVGGKKEEGGRGRESDCEFEAMGLGKTSGPMVIYGNQPRSPKQKNLQEKAAWLFI